MADPIMTFSTILPDAAEQLAAPVAHPLVASGNAALDLAPVVLTVQNRRLDGAARQVVLFKRNSAAGFDDVVVAWKVIRCPAGQDARVVVPFAQQIGVYDPCGAHAGLEDAFAGDMFSIAPGDGASDGGGHAAAPRLGRIAGKLVKAGAAERFGDQGRPKQLAAVGPNMVGVRNATPDRALDVVLYKDGRPLCRQNALAPGAAAVFEVLPYLHAAVCQGITEGALVDAATVAGATRISLLGLKSAELVLTGAAGTADFQLRNPRFS